MLLGFFGFHNDSEHVLTLTHLLATNMLRTIVKSVKSKQHSQNMLRTIVKSKKSKQHSQNMLKAIAKSPQNKKNKDQINYGGVPARMAFLGYSHMKRGFFGLI